MVKTSEKFALLFFLLIGLGSINIVSSEEFYPRDWGVDNILEGFHSNFVEDFVLTQDQPNHVPIIIIGDDYFTPENGVIGGSGTKNDPYIIANWVIQANWTAPYGIGTVGIFIANTTKYFVIRNVTIFGGDWGILLDNVSNFVIEDSKFYNINSYAIVAGGVTDESLAFNGTIRSNEAWDVDSFVWATGSNFIIEDNYAYDLEVKSGAWSIGIGVAANNSIVRNNDIHDINVTNGENGEKHHAHGIFIEWASNVSIYNNTIINMTIPDWGVHGIATLYAVNVKIYNNTAKNIDDNGISLFEGSKNILVNNNLIENCEIRNILVYGALDSNITIRENVLRNADDVAGIGIEHSSDVFVMDNEIYESKNRGIHLLNSTAIHIVGNNIHDNPEGIRIEEGSGDAYLESNWIHSNNYAILILDSPNATMKSNTLENNSYNLGVWAYTNVEGYLHHIDTSNTIDGRPIYYWVGVENAGIPQNASFVGLINCRNITGENLQLEHEGRVLIVNSTEVTIKNSILQNNEFAVDIILSADVVFKNVSILNTDKTAVSVLSSQRVSLDNISIYTAGWDGVYFEDAHNSSILNSEISSATNGINLHYSTQNTIQNNSIHHNRDRGISLWDFSENNLVETNNVHSNNGYAISLDAGNNTVRNNKVHDNNADGIISANSNENQILQNEIWNNTAGIRFWNSNHTLISVNEIHDNRENGISSDNSFNAVIQNNTVYRNKDIGIGFWRSGNFSVVGNTVRDNGFAGIVSGHGSNATLRNNVVFLNNASGIEVWEGSHLQIINVTVYNNSHAGIWVIHPGTFALIENSTVYENAWRGIEFHDGGYGVVKSSRIFNNSIDGIYIANTGNVTITSSNIGNNNACGIAADYTANIILLNSTIKDNKDDGIKLYETYSSLIQTSFIQNNEGWGIWINQVENITISHNLFTNNSIGLFIHSANNNYIVNNTFKGDGLFIWYPSTNFIENNIVNGKPLIYYENLRDTVLEGEAGQVILVNPVNVTVRNFNISNVGIGIQLIGGRDNRIINNYLWNTWDGINVRYSHNDIIQNNTLLENGWIFCKNLQSSKIGYNYVNGIDSGIYLTDGSANNVIYGNTIAKESGSVLVIVDSSNNTIYMNNINGEVYIENSTFLNWHSPIPLSYLYNNQTFTSYLGNYWQKYIGEDFDGDGIGDTPYIIDLNNKDEYPLVAPIENYSVFVLRPFPIGEYTSAVDSANKVFFVFNNFDTPDAFSTSQYVSRTLPLDIRPVSRLADTFNLDEVEASDVIISVGGPLVNRITAQYDNISQVHMVINGREIIIETPDGNITWSAPRPWWNVTEGYFIIQGFYDGELNATVFIIYGTDADSTAAGAYYFMNQVYPNIETYQDVDYIVGHWIDTEYGADIPLPGSNLGDTSGFSAGDTITIVFMG